MRSVFPDTRPDALQIGTFFQLFRPFADKRPTPVAQRARASYAGRKRRKSGRAGSPHGLAGLLATPHVPLYLTL